MGKRKARKVKQWIERNEKNRNEEARDGGKKNGNWVR